MIAIIALAIILLLVMFANEVRKARIDNDLIESTMVIIQDRQSGLAQRTAELESGILSLQQMTYVSR